MPPTKAGYKNDVSGTLSLTVIGTTLTACGWMSLAAKGEIDPRASRCPVLEELPQAIAAARQGGKKWDVCRFAVATDAWDYALHN